MANGIEITDVRERDALMGTVQLQFRLTTIPGAGWRKAFDNTSVSYQGPGTLDYVHIAPLTMRDGLVSWRVPANLKDQARGYVQQRVDHANAVAPLPDIMGIEEPSQAGGQWHALDLSGGSSWPEKTMCRQVEPRESWRQVDHWVEAGERRCLRCSDLASAAGLPHQSDVRRADRQWSSGW